MTELDRKAAVCPDCGEKAVVLETSPDVTKPPRLRCKGCNWVDVDDPRLQPQTPVMNDTRPDQGQQCGMRQTCDDDACDSETFEVIRDEMSLDRIVACADCGYTMGVIEPNPQEDTR